MAPWTEPNPPHAEWFLTALTLGAAAGLAWLLSPFLPGLFLALLLASATYPLHRKLKERFYLQPDAAAFTAAALMMLLVVTPVVYLLTSSALRIVKSAGGLRRWMEGLQGADGLARLVESKLALLPIPQEAAELLIEQLNARQEEIAQWAAQAVLFLFQGITGNAAVFFASLGLIAFSLFFFYRDGPALAVRFATLLPLPRSYADLLLERFAALSTTLTLSVAGVALLQGLSFSLAAFILDLPWFYLGVAMAVASFIPVAGGLLVWLPSSWYLWSQGRTGAAIFLALWGAAVIGFAIDNLVRPLIIGYLAGLRAKERTGGDINALNHTLLVVLSTLGGILSFGVLGLLFGPIIAAMALTAFDLHAMRQADRTPLPCAPVPPSPPPPDLPAPSWESDPSLPPAG
ncbi:MAG: AI-2E family transporter [Magnetococcales bacterium]|nr:AI-2E family transporter [Magnetococcales bacterium]